MLTKSFAMLLQCYNIAMRCENEDKIKRNNQKELRKR